jgi:three-Cys-motif partner protein
MPMATGADDRYWERQGLPSVFKHDLLTRYLPQFGGKTGSKARGVVYLDGYAGRGRYEDKTPGSAERIMQIAEQQGTVGIAYRLFFYESDQKSYAALQEVVDEYAARGLRAAASRDDVITGLPGVITAAEDKSLFLFLDPCGLGLPFADLTATLTGPRASKWPPTEILLNFSLYAVRRIAGHVFSPTPNEKTTGRLDTALGGTWWRDVIRKGGLTEDAVEQIVQEFVNRLSKATSMHIYLRHSCASGTAPQTGVLPRLRYSARTGNMVLRGRGSSGDRKVVGDTGRSGNGKKRKRPNTL